MAARSPVEPTRDSGARKSPGHELTFRLSLVLGFIVLLVNANTLPNGWALDDTLVITDNEFTQRGISALPEIWSSDVFTGYFGRGGVEVGGRYRPLSGSAFAIQHELVGNNPLLGHGTNVLLYALTCLVLFRVLKRLFPPRPGDPYWKNLPFLASVLFAVHPLHAEVVANIKSLDEILALLFALLATWLLTRSAALRIPDQVLFAGAFFLALCAKESAITFLTIAPLVRYYLTRELRSVVLPLLVLLVPTALYFLLRTAALGDDPAIVWQDDFLTNPFHGASGSQRIATILSIWGRYLGLMIVPHPLTTDYYPAMVPITGWTDPAVWLVLAVVACALVLCWRGLRRTTVVGFGIAYFIITFSVASNLVIDLGTPMNDRFLFAPLAGFSLLVAHAFDRSMDRSRSLPLRRVIGSLFALVLLVYAVLTIGRNRDWKDDLTLFAHDVEVSIRSARCNVMYGKLCFEASRATDDPVLRQHHQEEAEKYLHRGLAIHVDYHLAWGLLGVLAMDRHQDHEAAEHFIRCLSIEPKEAVALKNLAVLGRRMASANDREGAERALRALNQFDSTAADPYLVLADLRMRTQPDSAISLLDRLQRIEPSNPVVYRMRGEILAVYLHDPASAERSFLTAHELDPGNSSVLTNLGVAAFQRKDYPKALAYFTKALALSPNDPNTLQGLGSTYGALGDAEKMNDYLTRAERARQQPAGQ